MSFENPTSWTDVDSAGTPLDWSSRTEKLLYPAYEMLRLALAERCEAAGVSVPAALTERTSQQTHYPVAWRAAFDATMDTLIGSFVNHTHNGGDWDGWAPSFMDYVVAPPWTEALILAAIGAGARMRSTQYGYFSAAWSLQQYELLRMLRWTKPTCTSAATQYREGTYVGSDPWASGYAAAAALYAAAAWIDSGLIGSNAYAMMQTSGRCALLDPRTYIDLRRYRVAWTYGGISVARPHAAVAYLLFDNPDGRYHPPVPNPHVYDHEGAGWTEDVYSLYESYAEAAVASRVVPSVGQLGDIATTPPIPPVPAAFPNNGTSAQGWTGSSPALVLKWNFLFA